MSRALRFIARMYLLPVVGSVAVISAIAFFGSQIMYLEVVASWYVMLPMFSIIFAVIYSFSLVTLYRQLALSANCRRRDFFWGSQISFLIFALANTAIIAVVAVLPRLLHIGYDLLSQTEDLSLFEMVPLYAAPASWPVLFLLFLALQPVGTAMGELYYRSKLLSTVLMVVYMVLSVAAVVVALFATDGTIDIGTAPMMIALGVLLVIGIVCDILFARTNARAVVR